MQIQLSWRRHLFALALSAALVAAAGADGKFFASGEAAVEPGVRAQRAVIAFKDGVETLIVQSDVAGAAAEYGWLLPLPAEPTQIEACAPGSLNALGRLLAPTFVRYPRVVVALSVFLVLIVTATCLDDLAARARPAGARRARVPRVLVGVALTLIFFVPLIPSLARARGGEHAASGVDVLQTTRAGVYDAAVIKGQTAADVEHWLNAGGWAAPPAAMTVIEDYLARGWCLLAAKVAAENQGAVTHHPLKVVFPAKEAVYPLALTGSDGQPIQLDLYVVGAQRAAADRLQTWLSAPLEAVDSGRASSEYRVIAGLDIDAPPVYQSSAVGVDPFGIPAVSELCWEGCVVTRLHGRLTARDMRSDLQLTWRDADPFRAMLYSPASAAGWSAVAGLLVVATVLAWCTRQAARRNWSGWRLLLRRLLPAIALGLLVAGVRYAIFDRVRVNYVRATPALERAAAAAHWNALSMFDANMPPELRPDLPFPAAYRAQLRELLPAVAEAELATLESVGDYRITTTTGGWKLTFVDAPHVVVTVNIPAEPTPRAAAEPTPRAVAEPTPSPK